MSAKATGAGSRWTIGLAILAVGVISGIFLPTPGEWRTTLTGWFAKQFAGGSLDPSAPQPEDDHGHDHEHDDNVVAVSDRVRASLGISIAPLKLDQYTGQIEVHGFVRELPGTQDMRISSRYAGVVTEVFVMQGTPVKSGDPLCRIQLVGEDLARAQTELLDSLTQLEITAAELDRLKPLVDSGGVTGRRLLELEYERQRLQARAETRRQELYLRGLTETQVHSIESQRRLISEVIVAVPDSLLPPQVNLESLAAEVPKQFYVESLNAKPGTYIATGTDLAHLAFHEVLAVEGHAFEKDLPHLRQLIATGGTVDLSIGPEIMEVHLNDLKIAYLSNHADGNTNSFPFYVYFLNRPHESTANSNVERTPWKPGQRAHVHIPQQVFVDKYVLPREAVVLDGIRHLVFRRLPPQTGADAPGQKHSHGDEYEPIEVRVLYQDRRVAVIEPNDELPVGEWVAEKGASHLYFAWQAQQAGGGGGHDHDH